MKKIKKTPPFATEQEEKAFWQKHDSTEYVDWSKAKRTTFPELKPSTHTISLRLPENLLNEIKVLAHKQDIPYQSLMKIILSEGVNNMHRGK